MNLGLLFRQDERDSISPGKNLAPSAFLSIYGAGELFVVKARTIIEEEEMGACLN
jgi:hypothetical protein